jgi:hypothetical protein
VDKREKGQIAGSDGMFVPFVLKRSNNRAAFGYGYIERRPIPEL